MTIAAHLVLDHQASLPRSYHYWEHSKIFSMSYPFPPAVSVRPTGGGTSIKSTLLTPPITPLSADDVPYRAATDDNVSLNMRKGKRTCAKTKSKEQQKRPQQARASSSEVPTLDTMGRIDKVRSHSLGLIARPDSGSVSPGSVKAGTPPSEDGTGNRSRRWTLSSKSAATRGFTPLKSTVKQATLSDRVESPAMITLRRATTNKSPKRNELTFFPEPKFGNESNGLLSYLVSTFTMSNLSDMAAPLFADAKSSRNSSVGSGAAHPVSTYPAATVCTETTVESSFINPGYRPVKPSSRRCSARYISGETNYEVIWDDNDSLTSTQDSSGPSVPDRRMSMAVVKLESQLARSDTSSRRPSDKSMGSSTRASLSSAKQKYAQALTPDKLEQLFPRLLHKAGMGDLPRSRTGRKRRSTVCSITVDEPEQQTLAGNGGRKASTFTIDFFPPLSNTTSRRTSAAMSPSRLPGAASPCTTRVSHSGKDADTTLSASPPKRRPGLGSMVGSSSHIRRRSSAMHDVAWRRESTTKQLARSKGERVSKEQARDSDTAPLLGSKGKGRASHK